MVWAFGPVDSTSVSAGDMKYIGHAKGPSSGGFTAGGM
jgi:hypothetical protein